MLTRNDFKSESCFWNQHSSQAFICFILTPHQAMTALVVFTLFPFMQKTFFFFFFKTNPIVPFPLKIGKIRYLQYKDSPQILGGTIESASGACKRRALTHSSQWLKNTKIRNCHKQAPSQARHIIASGIKWVQTKPCGHHPIPLFCKTHKTHKTPYANLKKTLVKHACTFIRIVIFLYTLSWSVAFV